MSLLYKDDWEAAKERFRAWWAGESIGRAAIAVTAPRDGPPPVEEPRCPDTPEERWTDLDYISALSEYRNSRTFFGGEAFPTWGYGYPGNKRLAAFLGCPVHLDWHTGWLGPILTGEDIEYESLALGEDEPHFQFTLRWLRRSAEDARGKAIPGVGAFGGCGDTLAALRGTNRLLYDVVDRPEQVRAADRRLMDIWIETYSRFYEIVSDTAEGSTCWFSLWAPGKFYAVQNDFSFNISPRMFEGIFLPLVEKQVRFLDYSVYHLDGAGAFGHVDALCDLAELNAIQVLPGAGHPSPLHYMDVLRKVQAAGKGLHITIPADEVREALESLSARGLFIQTRCESERQARALLKDAEKLSRG